ncbi:competence type IV pilus ATPase ComGA [Bacillus sp. 2205SS5-2]|uniref:competence type IV pilus ATPase ComGA n=1 Tax=Bacillus sp. 2205SS5-2 TaxID=3109031 RepID=UPI0030062627
MLIENVVNVVLESAIDLDATDIHVLPRKHDYSVQYRVLGYLHKGKTFSFEEGERLISHFKFKASMDIGEKRKPQTGALHFFFQQRPLAIRLSTLPTAHNKESLVIRILPQTAALPIQQMSLFPSSARKLHSLLMHSHGLIIFTGPTGSGKTTTLYSLIEHCSNQLNRHVITLEDPVEKQNEELLQVQVNEKAGITYANGLRAILRHDPDIIMVGEIRDQETAEIAIRAALTGHLVLTTLHTRDAKGAIYRLLEFGIKWEEIQQTLIAVTAQRLVRLQCPLCGDLDEAYCISPSHHKRVSVYEILSGQALQMIMNEARGLEGSLAYPLIEDLLRKGVALGYISEVEFNRWAVQKEKISTP